MEERSEGGAQNYVSTPPFAGRVLVTDICIFRTEEFIITQKNAWGLGAVA